MQVIKQLFALILLHSYTYSSQPVLTAQHGNPQDASLRAFTIESLNTSPCSSSAGSTCCCHLFNRIRGKLYQSHWVHSDGIIVPLFVPSVLYRNDNIHRRSCDQPQSSINNHTLASRELCFRAVCFCKEACKSQQVHIMCMPWISNSRCEWSPLCWMHLSTQFELKLTIIAMHFLDHHNSQGHYHEDVKNHNDAKDHHDKKHDEYHKSDSEDGSLLHQCLSIKDEPGMPVSHGYLFIWSSLGC